MAHEWLWLAADERSDKGQDQRPGSDREQSSGMQSNGSVSRAAALHVPSANVAGATGLGTQLSSVAGPTLQVRVMLAKPEPPAPPCGWHVLSLMQGSYGAT